MTRRRHGVQSTTIQTGSSIEEGACCRQQGHAARLPEDGRRRRRGPGRGRRPHAALWPPAAASSGDSSGGGSGGGREIKIGFVTPLTGPLASFGIPDAWCVKQWEAAVADGLECGDGQKHPIKFIVKDTQSDTNRAARSPATSSPTTAATSSWPRPPPTRCRRSPTHARPCRCRASPTTARGRRTSSVAAATPPWASSGPTTAGGASRASPPRSSACGTRSRPTRRSPRCGPTTATASPGPTRRPASLRSSRPAATPSSTAAATRTSPRTTRRRSPSSRTADAQILSGVMLPPDFTNFWKQSLQQGFNPTIATVGKALLFPQSLEALGDIGYGLSSECWWSPNHPYKSSLTGQTCKELADQYETDNGAQWTQPAPALRHLRGRRRRPQVDDERRRQGRTSATP